MIIGQADLSDYVVLPISSISDRRRVNPDYDIFLDKNKYVFLSKDSYLRTNKQTIVNVASLKDQLSDFKNQYEETYIEALRKVEKFQNELISRAI